MASSPTALTCIVVPFTLIGLLQHSSVCSRTALDGSQTVASVLPNLASTDKAKVLSYRTSVKLSPAILSPSAIIRETPNQNTDAVSHCQTLHIADILDLQPGI